MENDKLFAVYDKYLASGELSETDDDSDIDMSFMDEIKTLATSKDRRRSSIAPMNNTTIVKEHNEPVAQQSAVQSLTNDLLSKVQKDSLSIPSTILDSLSEMGDEKVIRLITELFEDFNTKQTKAPSELAQQTLQRQREQLTKIKQLFDDQEERFNRLVTLIGQQNFKERFNMNATLNGKSNFEEELAQIDTKMTSNSELVYDLKIGKEVGLK